VKCYKDAHFRDPELLFRTREEVIKSFGEIPKDKSKLAYLVGRWLIFDYARDRKFVCVAKCLGCNKVQKVLIYNILSGKSTQCQDCGNEQSNATREELNVKKRELKLKHPVTYKSYCRIKSHRDIVEEWDTFEKFVASLDPLFLDLPFNILDKTKPLGPDNFKLGAKLRNKLKVFGYREIDILKKVLGVSKQAIYLLNSQHASQEELFAARPDIKAKLEKCNDEVRG